MGSEMCIRDRAGVDCNIRGQGISAESVDSTLITSLSSDYGSPQSIYQTESGDIYFTASGSGDYGGLAVYRVEGNSIRKFYSVSPTDIEGDTPDFDSGFIMGDDGEALYIYIHLAQKVAKLTFDGAFSVAIRLDELTGILFPEVSRLVNGRFVAKDSDSELIYINTSGEIVDRFSLPSEYRLSNDPGDFGPNGDYFVMASTEVFGDGTRGDAVLVSYNFASQEFKEIHRFTKEEIGNGFYMGLRANYRNEIASVSQFNGFGVQDSQQILFSITESEGFRRLGVVPSDFQMSNLSDHSDIVVSGSGEVFAQNYRRFVALHPNQIVLSEIRQDVDGAVLGAAYSEPTLARNGEILSAARIIGTQVGVIGYNSSQSPSLIALSLSLIHI